MSKRKQKAQKAARPARPAGLRLVPVVLLPVDLPPAGRLAWSEAAGRWLAAHVERPYDGEPDEARDLAAASKG